MPKKVDVKIIENNIEEVEENKKDNKEKNFKKLFEVSNCEVSHDTVSNLSTHDAHDSHDSHDLNDIQENITHEHEYNIDFNFITENDITKFNNYQKLKKIHSTYHLKRKVSIKFQNQVKIYANN